MSCVASQASTAFREDAGLVPFEALSAMSTIHRPPAHNLHDYMGCFHCIVGEKLDYLRLSRVTGRTKLGGADRGNIAYHAVHADLAGGVANFLRLVVSFRGAFLCRAMFETAGDVVSASSLDWGEINSLDGGGSGCWTGSFC